MTCAEYLAGRLAGDESQEMTAHRRSCAACAARDIERAAVAAALAEPSTWAVPSAGLEEAVVAAVGELDRMEGPAEPTPVAAPPILRVATAPSRRSWGWLGWAAVAAVIVGVSIPVIRSNAPDWEVTLAGTGPSPQATATVAGWATDSGTRMRIDAEDLPPAPEGWVYELWLSRGDVHLSAGSFTAADGVDLWTGVSRRDFPRVWVTLEPVDADTSVNGEAVLDQSA
jgi:Anti-sigma-K factor rskA